MVLLLARYFHLLASSFPQWCQKNPDYFDTPESDLKKSCKMSEPNTQKHHTQCQKPQRQSNRCVTIPNAKILNVSWYPSLKNIFWSVFEKLKNYQRLAYLSDFQRLPFSHIFQIFDYISKTLPSQIHKRENFSGFCVSFNYFWKFLDKKKETWFCFWIFLNEK